MRKILTAGLIFVALVAFGLGNSRSALAAKKDWPKGLTFGTAPMGSTYFILLTGWAQLVTQYVGIQNAVESTGGPAANMVLIHKKQLDLGAATNLVLWQGWHGKAWAKGNKYRDVRAILPLYPGVLQLYALKKSGIKGISAKYLDGKKVNVGPPQTTPGILGPLVFDILNIKPKVVHLGWADSNSALRDGLLDAVFILIGIPAPTIVEMTSTHKMIISSILEEDIPKVRKALPLMGKTKIPANMYKGQTKDIPTIDVWGYMLARPDLPDDLVYEICKATIDHHDDLLKVHKSAKYIKRLEAIKDCVIPLHPGAIKFFKERGIEVPKK